MNIGFGSQRPSFSSSARPSFGAANAEKPLFGIGNSERPSFGVGSSHRPSISSTTSQRPSFGSSSQRSTAFLGAPFLDDDIPVVAASSGQAPGLGPVTMSLSLPTTRSVSHVGAVGSAGSTSRAASPPSLNGGSGLSSNWPDLSGVASPKGVGPQASPRHGNTQVSPKGTTEHISPKTSALADSILNTHSSSAFDPAWGVLKSQLSKDPCKTKANGAGEVDHVATALGALGMRRANRGQNGQAEEKKKPSTPSAEQQSHSSSISPPPTSQGQSKKSSQSSSHRHPGPISLPPPTTFTLPPGVVLSPHAHPQSPLYHPGYPLTPMHPYPMGSPLHHPLGSPLPHPAHMHSPLHHPGHAQYGTYPHLTSHTTPMHYGVITPHGLPPITPGMPPFTFLAPQARTQGQSGHGRGENGGEDEWSEQGLKNEGGRTEGQNWKTPAQPPQPSYYAHPPLQHMQYVAHVHPHPFSPSISLSPGIMVPLSPGIMPPAASIPMSSVPMTPSGVQVLTPGVAMTPGVTMTPGAFWPHASWINPAVGAPVHVHGDGHNGHKYPGSEGYFPPINQPSGDTGYFPPVLSVANEILKEDSGLGLGSGSGSDGAPWENVNGGSKGSGTESMSRNSLSRMSTTPALLDPSRDDSEDNNRKKGGPHVIKRTTSVQCESGLAKRNGLSHRESDPEMTTATNKGGATKEA
ncbi:hypothetical protein BS17DRAFT_777797 [Gyrodon lividus]|nr:hypothetical protein BS17DRAFT_777797 [Gyrodon lividus]